jgi:hypothetical protein
MCFALTLLGQPKDWRDIGFPDSFNLLKVKAFEPGFL